jgi:hypothetical protein
MDLNLFVNVVVLFLNKLNTIVNKYTIKNNIDLAVPIRLLKLKVEIDLDILDR